MDVYEYPQTLGKTQQLVLCTSRVPEGYSYTSISSMLFPGSDRRLFFISNTSRIYRPTAHRSVRSVFVSLILLLGGVEANPGPYTMGLLNVHCAEHKAALIHDVIQERRLDLLVLTETWLLADMPPAVTDDMALAGYSAIHRLGHPGVRCGGVSLVFRDGLLVSRFNMSATVTTFEYLATKIITPQGRVNLVSLYRSPSSSKYGASIGDFCVEFDDFLDELLELPGESVLCGDFNCPGSTDRSIDHQLLDVIESRDLRERVGCATRDGWSGSASNLLDLIVTNEHSPVISSVTVHNCSFSDHKFLQTDLRVLRPQPIVKSYSY